VVPVGNPVPNSTVLLLDKDVVGFHVAVQPTEPVDCLQLWDDISTNFQAAIKQLPLSRLTHVRVKIKEFFARVAEEVRQVAMNHQTRDAVAHRIVKALQRSSFAAPQRHM
jgi:hypothetical protein